MARDRRRGTPVDMAISLSLIGGLAVVILLLGASRQLLFPTGRLDQRVHPVDPAEQIAAAGQLAPGVARAPRGLSSSWQTTSSRFHPAGAHAYHLHLGWYTPRQQYAAFEEWVGQPAPRAYRTPHRSDGTVVVDGVTWQRYRTSRGELLLEHTRGPALDAVTGSASLAELRVLAGALAPVAGSATVGSTPQPAGSPSPSPF